MLQALLQLVAQTASYQLHGVSLNATAPMPPAPAPFQPSPTDIRVNVLWFASLLFSLITASFGILVKQWLREYLAVDNPSPQARLRVRHLRYPQLAAWQVFEIAAVLPLLLQLSLGLFFTGMCYFTASVHSSIGHTSLPLVTGWAFCFIAATLMPIFFPLCPYRTTILKSLMPLVHRHVQDLVNRAAMGIEEHLDPSRRLKLQLEIWTNRWSKRSRSMWRPIYHALRYIWDATRKLCSKVARVFTRERWRSLMKRIRRILRYRPSVHKWWWFLEEKTQNVLQSIYERLEASDETKVVLQDEQDLEILGAADAIQSNDELLSTNIAEAVGKIRRPEPEQMLAFISRLIDNRVQPASGLPILDVELLPDSAQPPTLNIISQFLEIMPEAYRRVDTKRRQDAYSVATILACTLHIARDSLDGPQDYVLMLSNDSSTYAYDIWYDIFRSHATDTQLQVDNTGHKSAETLEAKPRREEKVATLLCGWLSLLEHEHWESPLTSLHIFMDSLTQSMAEPADVGELGMLGPNEIFQQTLHFLQHGIGGDSTYSSSDFSDSDTHHSWPEDFENMSARVALWP